MIHSQRDTPPQILESHTTALPFKKIIVAMTPDLLADENPLGELL